MLINFPLLILALIAYNILAFFTGTAFDAEVFSLTMMSGGLWSFSVSDCLLLAALLLLFFELIKSTRTDSTSIIDHGLSTLVFIICLIEFVLVSKAATSTFFFITIMSLIDVVAGYSITIRAARRDFAIGPNAGL
jgi:hypothetical protein